MSVWIVLAELESHPGDHPEVHHWVEAVFNNRRAAETYAEDLNDRQSNIAPFTTNVREEYTVFEFPLLTRREDRP